MILRCKAPRPAIGIFKILPTELERARSSIRAAKRNIAIMQARIERLEKVRKLADELCDAVDRKAEDIGGARPVLEILQELGPACDAANKSGKTRK